MKKIYSKLEPKKLLHIIYRATEIEEKRCDISPDTEYLQVSAFELPKDKTFKAHKHIELHRSTDITQESWVVISGSIKAFHYDLDDTLISEEILSPGDVTITFFGGHNYLSLEDNSRVYEFKTGPYMGQAKDKEFI
jgi:hypothetical protein